MTIWDDFPSLTGVTRGGRGSKNCKFGGDVIYGWSLIVITSEGVAKMLTWLIFSSNKEVTKGVSPQLLIKYSSL